MTKAFSAMQFFSVWDHMGLHWREMQHAAHNPAVCLFVAILNIWHQKCIHSSGDWAGYNAGFCLIFTLGAVAAAESVDKRSELSLSTHNQVFDQDYQHKQPKKVFKVFFLQVWPLRAFWVLRDTLMGKFSVFPKDFWMYLLNPRKNCIASCSVQIVHIEVKTKSIEVATLWTVFVLDSLKAGLYRMFTLR